MNATKLKVRIQSDKSLQDLARELQDALSLPDFRLDSDMDPPHNITAMTECLGQELWLYSVDNREYELVVEASMTVQDEFESERIDVSPWFAKHLATITDLRCIPNHEARKKVEPVDSPKGLSAPG